MSIGYIESQTADPTITHTDDNTVTAASEILVAANAARRGIIIQNTHATENVRVNLAGNAATVTNGLQLKAGVSLTLTGQDCPTNAITAIREGAADATVHVVELT